ncbi:RNase H1/viroplasmin domain-containing protein [Bacillus changyiensis]|uniref:RNase H1/viroplasmin domain-containing protein n=1 Tax=Bacillus changyiensis TaxID=3004103 RepID=UPI0022E7FF92|nr:RNase H1/viroplasmin domain-containing protein [Bacillus changyiensis]MDA1477252.1 RNase H1/viroplasmin domain-containing protein [Bacillus changyiensis]
MTKRFYIVRRGHETGIFTTWDEYMKAVSCYSKPEFKSFASMKEAQIFLMKVMKKKKHNQNQLQKLKKKTQLLPT